MATARTPSGRPANTFVIRVIETEDKQWNGVITHVQTGRKTSFRGMNEAVRFMEGLIRHETDTKTDSKTDMMTDTE